MYNDVSQDYIDAVRSDARCWKPRLVFSNFTLYNIDTINFTNGSQSNDNITVGSVVSPTTIWLVALMVSQECKPHNRHKPKHNSQTLQTV